MGLNDNCLLLGGVILLILVMVVTEFRLFGFQFISLYFGFYVLGYLLRKYWIQFALSHIVILGVIWLVLAFFWRMHAVPASLQWATSYIPSSLLTYGYRYITAFIGSLFFIGFAMKCMNIDNATIRLLSYLGKISLGIYIIHLFLGKYIDVFYMHYFQSDTCLSFVTFDFFFKLGLSCLLVQLICRNPIVSLLLLGKGK